jgi:hypothetical protein
VPRNYVSILARTNAAAEAIRVCQRIEGKTERTSTEEVRLRLAREAAAATLRTVAAELHGYDE